MFRILSVSVSFTDINPTYSAKIQINDKVMYLETESGMEGGMDISDCMKAKANLQFRHLTFKLNGSSIPDLIVTLSINNQEIKFENGEKKDVLLVGGKYK